MSAILGTIQTFGHGLDSGRFQAMLDGLQLRGPDAEGIWKGQGVKLGHRMLRTTPEAHLERLPVHDIETECVITSDARLDNRRELIDSLGRASFKMDVIPDSVLILRAYRKWGNDCVHHLLGDFAFAIWDIKGQKLFCARDFLGVKPFNYCLKGGMFLFCSEPRIIAQYSGLSFSINESRIADSLTPHLEGYDTTSTLYKGIYRLPPAHILSLKDGNIQISRYWQPGPQMECVCKTDAEYQEALTEILTRAVADRCRGNEDPAILLSGGVDSATILGIAQTICENESRGTVHSYSGIAEDSSHCKESKLISLLSGTGDTNSHLFTPKDFRNHIESVFNGVSQLQEPFDFCMILMFLLYQQAAKDGKRAVLDGVDGDVATSLSYGYPAHLLRQFSFRAGWHEASLQSSVFFEGSTSRYKKYCSYFLAAFTPQILKDYRWRYKLPSRVDEFLSASVAGEQFTKKTELRERLLKFERLHRKNNLSFPNGLYMNGVQHPYLTVGLERYDRVASQCSIEPRHPLLDKRIIEFYMGVPWNQFMRDGWSKYLFRRVAEQFVPGEVCWRTGKEHVGWQFIKELLQVRGGEISSLMMLHREKLGEIVKLEYLNDLLGRDASTNKNNEKPIHIDVAALTLWLNTL